MTQTIEHDVTRDENRATAPRISAEAAARACSTLLSIEPVRIEYPGGASRCSVRAVADNKSCIVTRRKSAPRAALEAGVLRELRAAGARWSRRWSGSERMTKFFLDADKRLSASVEVALPVSPVSSVLI